MTAKYTPHGVRITKTRSFGDADDYDHKYIVDVSGKLPRILLILDASTNETLKTFIHADSQVIAQHDVDTSLYFYTHDRLGSVRAMVIGEEGKCNGRWRAELSAISGAGVCGV